MITDEDHGSASLEKRPGGERPAPGTAARMRGTYARERVLLACIILLLALFGFTAFVARQYHRTVHRLGDGWFAKGEGALQAGQAAAAITDYRNALVYKPDDRTFQFHLAVALARDGRDNEARSYLLSLLADSPGSGPINLALARAAVRLESNSDAIRYYHGAIYGVWDSDPLTHRWEARRELCEYLLARRDIQDAEPDLIALSEETPSSDGGLEGIAGDLLLRARLWSRALAAYRATLAVSRNDPDALVGAGRAAFQLAMYSDAADYFRRLPPDRRAAPGVADAFAMAQEAATMNALRPGLRASEAARKAAKALRVAESSISACAQTHGEKVAAMPPATPLQKLYATARQNRRLWNETNLAHHPDQVVAAMSFAAQAESAASAECGPPRSISDRALSLIAAGTARPASE